MRIAAVFAVVALLVLGGFWLAQNRQESPPQETTTPEAQGPEGSDGSASDAVGLEGYDPVPFLVSEPVTTFENAESVLEDGLDYAAVIDTSKGRIVIDLFQEQVPATVNNFVFLARNRYYDGIVFHRVLDNFMAQTGDPTGTGRGGPGYQFDDEIDPTLTHDQPGVLSMANAGPNTNGSQFFITFVATPWLDGRHAVFGRVTEGLDVLDRLTRVDPQNPSAIAKLSEPVSVVVAQGITLSGDPDASLESKLEETLGAAPVAGQSFTVDGFQGVVGAIEGEPAVGFFPEPDFIESVTVVARSQ